MDSSWEGWMYGVVGVVCLAVVLVIIRLLLAHRWGHCRNRVSLAGKTIVITGANSGIGFETAKELARRGGRLILACRSLINANRAVEIIRAECPQVQVEALELDLASFTSIHNFAKKIINDYPTIDILINNAGVAIPIVKDMKTEEGYEINFGVNHLGHFLLTNLLLAAAKISVKGRIIILSSSLMKHGSIDFEDLNLIKTIEGIKSGRISSRQDPGYANSKLMNAYHGKVLTNEVKNFKIDVFVLCPGFTYSSLFRYAFKWYFALFIPIFFFVMRSTKQGAQTSIYCATEPSIEGASGSFYRNCKKDELPVVLDGNIADRLWLVSKELTQIDTVN